MNDHAPEWHVKFVTRLEVIWFSLIRPYCKIIFAQDVAHSVLLHQFVVLDFVTTNAMGNKHHF